MPFQEPQGVLRDDEEDAAKVITAVLPGTIIPRDPGGGSIPVHDFDVEVHAGRSIAVEVTRYNVEAEVRQRAKAIRGVRRDPSLVFNWHLSMQRRYDPEDLLAQAPVLLADLEQRGVEPDDLGESMRAGADVALAALARLGVRFAYHRGRAGAGGGSIEIGDAPRVGVSSPDVIIKAVEACALRKGKAEKLAAADADERHLFLWIETSRDAAVAAMSSDLLPVRAPDIPELIDAIWLATRLEHPRVWQYGRQEGWFD